jgi:Asp-tRNA(Asn)/Glu-tRNA(Gln) amidotransferase A subunit family amidase
MPLYTQARCTIDDWRNARLGTEETYSELWKEQLSKIDSDANRSSVIVDHTLQPTVPELVDGAHRALEGVPFMVKDLFNLRGFKTTASSVFLGDVNGTSDADAPVVKWLKELGGLCLGKTHLNEFAYGLDGANVHFGQIPNPIDPEFICGGSSSGSAYSVAKGWVPFAIGTDTGGSIRVPAAYSGLFGFRFPAGRSWSSDGCVALAPSFDTVGWLTHTAKDMKLLLELLSKPSKSQSNKAPIVSITQLFRKELSDDILSTMVLIAEGWDLIEKDRKASDPDPDRMREAFNVLQSKEAYEVHKQWIPEYGDKYDPATLSKILRGQSWTADQLSASRLVQSETYQWLIDALPEDGALFMPSVPDKAPFLKQGMSNDERERILKLTSLASLTGHPVLCLPFRLPSSGFCGCQLILPKDLDSAVGVALSILSELHA